MSRSPARARVGPFSQDKEENSDLIRFCADHFLIALRRGGSYHRREADKTWIRDPNALGSDMGRSTFA